MPRKRTERSHLVADDRKSWGPGPGAPGLFHNLKGGGPLAAPGAIPKHAGTTTAASALSGLWTLALACFVFGALYFARDILMPLSLSALLTFLLAPLVTRVERWTGRVAAVLLVVLLILCAFGAAGWILTRQLVDLATKLPDYKDNIQTRLRAFRIAPGGRFTRISEAVEELKKDLPGGRTQEAGRVPGTASKADGLEPAEAPRASAAVQRVEVSNSNPFQLVKVIIAPVLGPLGTGALVLLLVVFMLLKREDLRSRLLRLIGQGRILATTRAMDDAGARVTRYLLTQLVLNASYGVMVALGLFFIGVPNSLLWGASAAVLRYIPYVGPWIGATIPIALSLAVSPGWFMPLATLGLFVSVELLSNNVFEPWLYGSSTGVSPIALILAAFCWTWLWGPVGLVLATPMTVCLVVLGRHIPRLSFLSIVLSDQDALTPAEDCYYRLLTVGEEDELELVGAYLKANSLTSLYDSVLIPVITAVEVDHRLQLLDDVQRARVDQSLREIVEDLGVSPSLEAGMSCRSAGNLTSTDPRPGSRVYCLPARADRDALAGAMLVQLLCQQGVEAECPPTTLDIGELAGLVGRAGFDVVCISVLAPFTVLRARYLCLRLRAQLPTQRIVVGLWGGSGIGAEVLLHLRESGADAVYTTLAEAVIELCQRAPGMVGRGQSEPAPVLGGAVVEAPGSSIQGGKAALPAAT